MVAVLSFLKVKRKISAKLLNNPNIVKVHDVNRWDSVCKSI
jgi:hypothetical protein